MTKRSKSSYIAVSNARYPDNTVGAIDAPVDRADKQDIADSFLNLLDGGDIYGNMFYGGVPIDFTYVKTVSVDAASLSTCGSVPVVLLPALGAGIIHPVVGVSMKFTQGSEEYDFESVVLKNTGGGINFFFNQDLNIFDGDFFRHYRREGNSEKENAQFVLTTEDGSDPSQGDGEIVLKIYYQIDNFN